MSNDFYVRKGLLYCIEEGGLARPSFTDGRNALASSQLAFGFPHQIHHHATKHMIDDRWDHSLSHESLVSSFRIEDEQRCPISHSTLVAVPKILGVVRAVPHRALRSRSKFESSGHISRSISKSAERNENISNREQKSVMKFFWHLLCNSLHIIVSSSRTLSSCFIPKAVSVGLAPGMARTSEPSSRVSEHLFRMSSTSRGQITVPRLYCQARSKSSCDHRNSNSLWMMLTCTN